MRWIVGRSLRFRWLVLFAAVAFRAGGTEFVCGTGDAFAIKRLAES